MLQQALFFTSF